MGAWQSHQFRPANLPGQASTVDASRLVPFERES